MTNCKFSENIFILFLIISVFIQSTTEEKGHFKSYNNEERQRLKLHEIINTKSIQVDRKDISKSNEILTKYKPNWGSLDSRPLPEWYDQSKIGIFIHWGVFSVPGIADAWFWNCWKVKRKQCIDFINANYKPGFTYQQFAPEFTAEFFDPNEWADLFKKSGARYVVLTSKHHEGYTLWPSKYSFSWNAMDVGPKRDIIREFSNALRKNTSLRFGLYHSLFEWYNPLYMQDHENNFTSDEFVRFKTLPELYEIVNEYKPEIIWSDGEWEAPSSYWKSTDFIAWLYNESPVKDSVITNDRWGHETMCKHGGVFTCSDRYNPGVLQPHKWENCMTLDKESWGIRRNARLEDYLTPEELITTIIESVSCGGNILVNVGPTKEGIIVPVQQERLLQMGEWLSINGEAIYNSVPWTYQNDTATSGVWYTTNRKASKIYAMMTTWPGISVHLGAVTPNEAMTISMLGSEGNLDWVAIPQEPGIRVILPYQNQNKSKWAWTLVISFNSSSSIDLQVLLV